MEITGPVDRKMVINALNSGANVYMADFEDSNAPTWCACTSWPFPNVLPLANSLADSGSFRCTGTTDHPAYVPLAIQHPQ